MAAESVLIDGWLFALLGDDTDVAALVGARIYMSDHAPQGAIYPFILAYPQFPTPDTLAMGGVRALVRPVYRVYAVDQTGAYSAVAPLADRIDALVQSASSTAPPATGAIWIFQAVRRQEWRRGSVEQGREYRQLGGVYEMIARQH